MPPKRMTANPVAPLRYRAGKPTGATTPPSDSESDSSSSDSESEAQKPAPRAPPPKAASFPKLGNDLASRQAAALQSRAAEDAARRAAQEDGFETASDSEAESGSGSGATGSGSDSASESDYDSDSSAGGGRPRFVAPTFVSKARRADAAPVRQEDDDAAVRREKADALLQAQLEREAAERAAGRRDWDDDEAELMQDVDDTDGLDPEAEHAAWRLRELRRVKRAREAIEAVEREKDEVERRRNLTAEEREREDAEHIGKQKEERDARGKMGYMQKYFHKGAFFQSEEGGDDAAAAEVRAAKERDVNAGRFQDDAVNRELLPQYMQIRDMTKLGKKGRTRYRDLKSEDTGRFGAELYDRRGKGDAGGRFQDRDREGPSGANEIAVGERRRRDDDGGGGRGDDKRPRYER